MGMILDSSVLIAAERQGQNARQMLASLTHLLRDRRRNFRCYFLAHGAARAETPQRKMERMQFIQELVTALPVHPVTASIALMPGRIDGENQAKGVRFPLPDLFIGATALELGYGVGTRNLRHFQLIPGLSTNRN